MCRQGASHSPLSIELCSVEESSFISTFVDIPRTYHSFSYKHEVKFIYDVISHYPKCMLYNIRIRRSFCFFSQRCTLATLSPPREQKSVLKPRLIYTLKRLLSVNKRAFVQWTETVGGDRVSSLQLRQKAKK